MSFSKPDCHLPPHPAGAGFSLIELSVVLVIVSIVAVMGLELTANYMNRTAYKVTAERLDTIDRALVAYRRVNNKLPCPAPEGVTATSACYGKELNGSGGAGTCNDIAGTCTASSTTSGTIVYGVVPVRDLGLPTSAMYDGYGQRFYYVVTRDLTYTSTFNATFDAISVRSGKLDDACTGGSALCQDRGNASYFLFSTGVDKRGSRSSTGNVSRLCQDTSSPADVQLTDGMIDTMNCRLGAALNFVKNGSTPIAVADHVYYDSRYNMGTTDNHFDDLVKWRSKGSL